MPLNFLSPIYLRDTFLISLIIPGNAETDLSSVVSGDGTRSWDYAGKRGAIAGRSGMATEQESSTGGKITKAHEQTTNNATTETEAASLVRGGGAVGERVSGAGQSNGTALRLCGTCRCRRQRQMGANGERASWQ